MSVVGEAQRSELGKSAQVDEEGVPSCTGAETEVGEIDELGKEVIAGESVETLHEPTITMIEG